MENQENRFADRNALGERMGETTWTTRDNFFQGAPPQPGGGWKGMGKGKGHSKNVGSPPYWISGESFISELMHRLRKSAMWRWAIS